MPQVDKLYVIDNSPCRAEHPVLGHAKIGYEFLDGNKGIAYAQNQGLKQLRKDSLDFCFFIDQDSIVEEDLVHKLYNHYCFLSEQGYRVGGIGPRPINRQIGKEYRGTIKNGYLIAPNITEVGQIISSSSFIPIENFNTVGDLDAFLFIDGVDHEWCWRCTYLTGMRFFISEDTHLSHQLGEGDRRFLWRRIAIATPFRTYYQFRNYFILSSRKYVPLYWKVATGIKCMIRIFYYPIFKSNVA